MRAKPPTPRLKTPQCAAWSWISWFAVLVLLILPGIAARADPQTEPIDFNTQIRPLLSEHCFQCHGPDANERKAGLRLDTEEGALGETASGARAVVPGELEESELFWRITSDDDFDKMPPPGSGRELSEQEIERLTRWVEEGAEWATHWAFLTPEPVPVPAVRDTDWPQNPIDHFVLSRLEASGLTPAPEADRARLIRRLSFDLTGLPPTPEEVDEFLADDQPRAYERLVDRLLDSPRFGERMAVDWLDVARYADTYGYQADVYRPMWPWRDWVIEAFNQNLPYDQFLTWQLAGDLLPESESNREAILATAFNRNHRQTNEGGSIEEEFRVDYVADRVDTFGTAFLGLTVACSRCHDHKYDPISQKEYYQLFSFFDNIDESGLYSHFTDATPTPTLRLFEEEKEREAELIEAEIQSAEAALSTLADDRRSAFEAWLAEDRKQTDPLEGVRVGLIGDFPLDAIEADQVENRANPEQPARLADNPRAVLGKVGGALHLSGEDNITLPMGNFTRNDPFSVSLWLQTPDHKERAVIFHRSRAWTDAGSRGYQLLIEDGKLSASLIHFWPGNAIGIQAAEPLDVGEWVHVVMAYDGSSRADGLVLYVNGQRAKLEVVRDNLYKDITGGGGDELTIGQRFRDRGFKNGLVDEIQVFERAITEIEAAHLCDQQSLVDRLDKADADRNADDREALFAFYLATQDEDYRSALAELKALRQRRSELVDGITEIMVMQELPEPRPTFLLERGEYDKPGEQVFPETPSEILPFSDDLPRDRLGLARWLTDPRHPLTARVAVNRSWQSLFGRGLVATPEDFGAQGQLPSHPELLDWLARSFIDSGWDVKGLLRLMVTSATYRQDSSATPELRARDPENLLLARGPRHRLSAEMIRDHALFSGGILVDRMGGPPVKPYQPDGLWEEKSSQSYVRDEGEGSRRRSLYTFWKRTSPPPAMITLDATTREVCVVQRQPTETPLQALVLLNDPQYVEAARALAERAFQVGGSTLNDRIRFAFRTLTARTPSPRELDVLNTLFEEQHEVFRSGQADPAAYLGIGDQVADPDLDPAELAAFAVLVQALFNHDESISKR